jgi:hypothetical protein
MLTAALARFEITEIVSDRMYVMIKCPILKKAPIKYQIKSTNDQLVRRGGFVGEVIQLNLIHIPDGQYFFTISNEEGNEFSLPFHKSSYQSQGVSIKEN